MTSGAPVRRDCATAEPCFATLAFAHGMTILAGATRHQFKQPVHFGRAKLTSGSDVLVDTEADFTRLDLAQHNNLHVHWGTEDGWSE